MFLGKYVTQSHQPYIARGDLIDFAWMTSVKKRKDFAQCTVCMCGTCDHIDEFP